MASNSNTGWHSKKPSISRCCFQPPKWRFSPQNAAWEPEFGDFCYELGRVAAGRLQNGEFAPKNERFLPQNGGIWQRVPKRPLGTRKAALLGLQNGGFGGRGPNSPPQNGCWSFVLPDDAFSAEKGPFYPKKAVFGPTEAQQSPQCAFLAMNWLLWGFFPCAEMAPLSPKMEDCSPGAAALFLKSPFLPPNEARFPQNAHFWSCGPQTNPF